MPDKLWNVQPEDLACVTTLVPKVDFLEGFFLDRVVHNNMRFFIPSRLDTGVGMDVIDNVVLNFNKAQGSHGIIVSYATGCRLDHFVGFAGQHMNLASILVQKDPSPAYWTCQECLAYCYDILDADEATELQTDLVRLMNGGEPSATLSPWLNSLFGNPYTTYTTYSPPSPNEVYKRNNEFVEAIKDFQWNDFKRRRIDGSCGSPPRSRLSEVAVPFMDTDFLSLIQVVDDGPVGASHDDQRVAYSDKCDYNNFLRFGADMDIFKFCPFCGVDIPSLDEKLMMHVEGVHAPKKPELTRLGKYIQRVADFCSRVFYS